MAGDCFAKAICRVREAFYIEGASQPDAFLAGVETMMARWTFDDLLWTDKKGLPALVCALAEYLREHPLDRDVIKPALLAERRAIEFNFAIPLPIAHPETDEPILYEGRCDMIAEYDGVLFVDDEKTTSRLGATWASQFRLRGQFMGYAWAARQYGYPVAGVFVRGVGLYEHECKVIQTVHNFPPYLIERWYETLLDDVTDMIAAFRSDSWPFAFNDACSAYSGCVFVDRCASRDPDRVPGFIQTDKLYFEK